MGLAHMFDDLSTERARPIKRLGLSSDREWFRTVINFSDWRENGQETYQALS